MDRQTAAPMPSVVNSHESCLVTGAGGFIGGRLAERLVESGRSVTCLVRPSSSRRRLEGLGVRICVGDVATGDGLDDALEGVEVVYHLAGAIRAVSRRTFLETNVAGARRTLEACARRNNPPVFVLVSSIAAAGPSGDGPPRREDEIPRPVSEYGRSKLAAEQVARSFADRVPVTIVRPGIVFGGGDRFTLQWFQSIARFGLHPVPRGVDSRFSLIHVDDLAELLHAAAARGVRVDANDASLGNGVYFAAHPTALTYRQIGEQIAEAMELHRPRMPRVPLWALGTYATLCETIARVSGRPAWIGLDKFREAKAGSWTCFAVKTAELNFDFSRSLAACFRVTVDDYRRLGLL